MVRLGKSGTQPHHRHSLNLVERRQSSLISLKHSACGVRSYYSLRPSGALDLMAVDQKSAVARGLGCTKSKILVYHGILRFVMKTFSYQLVCFPVSALRGFCRSRGRRGGLWDTGRAVPVVAVRSARLLGLRRAGSSGGRGDSKRGGRNSGAGNTDSARGSGCSRRSRSRNVSARTANTRNSDVVGIDFKSKVLEGVAVPYSIGRVVLRKRHDTRVLALVTVVLNNTFTDLGHVEQTVEEIRSPVEVGGTVGDVVAKHAHALEGLAELVREVTDDSLGCSVGTAPVASPAYKMLVLLSG